MDYKFYLIGAGCMGHVGNNEYILFTTEDEYDSWYDEYLKKED